MLFPLLHCKLTLLAETLIHTYVFNYHRAIHEPNNRNNKSRPPFHSCAAVSTDRLQTKCAFIEPFLQSERKFLEQTPDDLLTPTSASKPLMCTRLLQFYHHLQSWHVHYSILRPSRFCVNTYFFSVCFFSSLGWNAVKSSHVNQASLSWPPPPLSSHSYGMTLMAPHKLTLRFFVNSNCYINQQGGFRIVPGASWEFTNPSNLQAHTTCTLCWVRHFHKLITREECLSECKCHPSCMWLKWVVLYKITSGIKKKNPSTYTSQSSISRRGTRE